MKTWAQKIEDLVMIAKAAGSLIEVEREEPGSDGHKDALRRVKDSYDVFCEWRHDEPYLVDEIQDLLKYQWPPSQSIAFKQSSVSLPQVTSSLITWNPLLLADENDT